MAPTAAGGYRGGSRKGLDLTFGSPVSGISTSQDNTTLLRGGALLRTIRRVSDSKVISGPSLLVDEILRLHGVSSISALVTQQWAGNINALPPASDGEVDHRILTTPSMYLRRIVTGGDSKSPAKQQQQRIHQFMKGRSTAAEGTPSSKKPLVYRSPRIGLELSHSETTESLTHPRVVFVSRRYRYFTHPHLLTANGRGHTFLGVYQACLDSGKFDQEDNDRAKLKRELVKVTGLKAGTVVKYLADYEEGIENGKLKTFVGAAGKGAGSSPSTFLKMMGTLERVSKA